MSQGKIEMSSCKLQVQVEFHIELDCIEASAESAGLQVASASNVRLRQLHYS